MLLTITLAGCGANPTFYLNANNNGTMVELSKKNFQVVNKVSATVETSYIFGIGGFNEIGLFERAKAEMMEKADIEGKARAVINVTYEDHIDFAFIWVKRSFTVSGHVIEFTD